MPSKISPNDRCPCGSGKKYKRCCMESDRAAATQPGASAVVAGPTPDHPAFHLLSALERGDMKGVAASLDLVAPLFEATGPLGSIRFDPERFDVALVDALERFGDADDETRRRQTLKACIRASCDSHQARKLVRRMTALAHAAGLPPATEGALQFWLSTTEASLGSGEEVFLESPLLHVIAGEQADETLDSRHRAASQLRSLVAGLQDRTLSLSDVSRVLEEHGDELAALLETTPELAQFAASSVAKARAHIPRLMKGRAALRVLGMDEFLLLTMELRRLRADHGAGEVFYRALGDHLRDHPLGSVVLARLRLASKDSKLSSAKRDRFLEAGILLEMDPTSFFLSALKEGSFEDSVGENACMDSAASATDAIVALAAHYESLGLHERAARARKAAGIARTLPRD